jgi:hypothetical protein
MRTPVLLIVAAVLALACACKKEAPSPPPPKPAAAAPARTPKPPNKNDWGARACVYKACYAKFGAFGQVSGRIVVTLDATGAATSATYDRGKAPEPVKACIVEAARRVRVPGFFGPPGRIHCEYSGQLMAGGMEMIGTSWGFQEGSAPAK